MSCTGGAPDPDLSKLGAELRTSAADGNVDGLLRALAAGARADSVAAALAGGKQYTALHFATIHGHDACVKALLEAGADVEVQDADGRTAIDLVDEEEHPELAALLRAAPRAARLSARPAVLAVTELVVSRGYAGAVARGVCIALRAAGSPEDQWPAQLRGMGDVGIRELCDAVVQQQQEEAVGREHEQEHQERAAAADMVEQQRTAAVERAEQQRAAAADAEGWFQGSPGKNLLGAATGILDAGAAAVGAVADVVVTTPGSIIGQLGGLVEATAGGGDEEVPREVVQPPLPLPRPQFPAAAVQRKPAAAAPAPARAPEPELEPEPEPEPEPDSEGTKLKAARTWPATKQYEVTQTFWTERNPTVPQTLQRKIHALPLVGFLHLIHIA